LPCLPVILLVEIALVKGFHRFAKMRSPSRRTKNTLFPMTYSLASGPFTKSPAGVYRKSKFPLVRVAAEETQ
jgi:hypothetical protein